MYFYKGPRAEYSSLIMKVLHFYRFVLIVIISGIYCRGYAQTIDTLIGHDGQRLHFHIIKGRGIPILFESGSGDDGNVWGNILSPVSKITGATLITYDRAGYGKSDTGGRNSGVLTGVENLENCLRTLGYDGNIVLVAHSFGAFYAALYARRHTGNVKAALLIDPSSNYSISKKLTSAGNDHLLDTLTFPSTTSITAFLSEYTPFTKATDQENWKLCFQQFIDAAPGHRTGITAFGCGHYIFNDNPALVVMKLGDLYSDFIAESDVANIKNRLLQYSMMAINELKQKETNYRHSEEDINEWAYALMEQGELQQALNLFKLNTQLHPQSWNAYDSYGEALYKSGRKNDAIAMYRQSLRLNPKNENGAKMLARLGASKAHK